jgi:hypothetical protein
MNAIMQALVLGSILWLLLFSPVLLCAALCPARYQRTASCVFTILYGVFALTIVPFVWRFGESTSGQDKPLGEMVIECAIIMLSVWVIHLAKMHLARKRGWWGAVKTVDARRGFPVIVKNEDTR